MQEGGETGHWRYSGRGKAKGRSLSSSSTNPYKIRRNTTFLPHHTNSYQKKKKKKKYPLEYLNSALLKELGTVKLGIT